LGEVFLKRKAFIFWNMEGILIPYRIAEKMASVN